MRVIVGLFYALAALGALAGCIEFLLSLGLLPSLTPLDVAARTLRAIGFGLVPLCLARAVEGMSKPWAPSLAQIEERARLKAAEATAPGNQPAAPGKPPAA